MSSSSTSLWVTKRTVSASIVPARTPSRRERVEQSARERVDAARTRCWSRPAAGSTLPGQRVGERVGEPPRACVVVGQPLDHRLERDDARGRDHAGLAHAAAEARRGRRAPRRSRRPVPHSSEPTGAPKPFDRQNITVSAPRDELDGGTPSAIAAFQMRAPSQCTREPVRRARSRPPRRISVDAVRAARHAGMYVFSSDEHRDRRAGGAPCRQALDRPSAIDQAVDIGQRVHLHAAVHRRRPRARTGTRARARRTAPRCPAREHPERELVRHRARRHVERGLLAEQRGRERLSRLTVGSSPYTSSPTSASAIARRISGVGVVTVSERRSTIRGRRLMSAPASAGRIEAFLHHA